MKKLSCNEKSKFIKLPLVLLLVLVFLLTLGLKLITVEAEGEIAIKLSTVDALIGPNEAITINVNYSSDVAVKNVKVNINTNSAAGYKVDKNLSDSTASVNGYGMLGSVTVTAPDRDLKGNLIFTIDATDADNSSLKYQASASVQLSVDVPKPPTSVVTYVNDEGETIESIVVVNEVRADGSYVTDGEITTTTTLAATPTPYPGGTVKVKLNGKDEIEAFVSVDEAESIPDKYTKSSVYISGRTIKAYAKNAKNKLVYLKLLASGEAEFYLYDDKTNSIYHYFPEQSLELDGSKYTVYPINRTAPDGRFNNQSIMLNDSEISALVGDYNNHEYTLLLASKEMAAPQFYIYYKDNNKYKITPYSGTALAELHARLYPDEVLVATTNADEAETTEKPEKKANKKHTDWVFIIMIIILLTLVLGLILYFYLLKAAENKRILQQHYMQKNYIDEQDRKGRQEISKASSASILRRQPTNMKAISPNEANDELEAELRGIRQVNIDRLQSSDEAEFESDD